MSILIKGIEMPKGKTEEVVICIQPNGTIRDSHGILLTDAKAISITIPHERFIDELKRHRDEYANDHGWNISVLETLDTAITILEAEE